MPVARTHSARNDTLDADEHIEFTWKAEPASSNISFATNLTPSTFNDPMPPLVDRPEPSFTVSESTLFPPIDFADPSENEEGSTRTPHSRKKPPSDVPHIPRPPNAFILFRAAFIKQRHVSAAVETSHSTLSTIIGLTWQGLPDDEREAWHGKARAAREAHKRKWPEYAFKPTKDGGTPRSKSTSNRKKAGGDGRDGREKPTGRRKVREVGPTDHKRCSRIAQLLVEGKKGADLDKAISEFDKTHVPEVVTRFEAVVTAGMYEAGNKTGKSHTRSNNTKETKPRLRRSSSVPIIEALQPPFLQQPSSPAPRRLRASSSQPSRISTPSHHQSVFSAFSFPAKESNSATANPAFDFSYAFEGSSPLTVFDSASSPASGLYDAMMFPQTPCSPGFDYAYAESQPSSPLSVDTSSTHMDYQQCPSYPSTPSTPYFAPDTPYYDTGVNYSEYYEPASPCSEAAVPSLYSPTFYPSSPSYTACSSPSFMQSFGAQQDSEPIMSSCNGLQLPDDILSEADAPFNDSADRLADALSLFQNGLANAQGAYNMSYQYLNSAPDDLLVDGGAFDMGCASQKDSKIGYAMDADLAAFMGTYRIQT